MALPISEQSGALANRTSTLWLGIIRSAMVDAYRRKLSLDDLYEITLRWTQRAERDERGLVR